MNALADPRVGEYLNKHFVSAFQKVGTFRIVGQQKQGGNVASYFCAQDGRVLHVIPGPVNAETLLREARWVVETVQDSLVEYKKHGKSFKAQLRTAHAKRLRQDHGLTTQPVTFDTPPAGQQNALSYRDPQGNSLAPILPPPPIDGPDVSLTEEAKQAFRTRQEKARGAGTEAQLVLDRRGGRWAISNQGRAHLLLAAHSMKPIETLYGSIFEGILGERVSTKPIEITDPFPWHRRHLELRAVPQPQIKIRN